MAKKKTAADEILEGLVEFRDALKSGARISSRFTCTTVVLDLEPTAYGPKQVRQLRDMLRCSQAVFAKFLGVASGTVRAWEQGKSAPSDLAARFMDEIRLKPDYWKSRILDVAKIKKPTAIA